MPPTLKGLGINPPVFIRKIDSRGHWDPEECSNDEERATRVANRIFKEEVCSLWLVRSDSDFYGIVASLSARRSPKQQDINFIWVTEQELKELDISLKLVSEGACLDVENLHYNADISSNQAIKLCRKLITENRNPMRCKKKDTTSILAEKEQMGCRAMKSTTKKCSCELKSIN